MYTFFLICTVVAGTILVLQVGLSLLGVGFDAAGGDPHVGHGSGALDGHSTFGTLGKMLTFQAILAFVTFFGVGGLASIEFGLSPLFAVPIALVTGLASMFFIATLLTALSRLHADGTARLEQAIGARGKVYLRIPAFGAGLGKVTLILGERTVEVAARTAGPALPTGETIVVTGLIDSATVEVLGADSVKEKPLAHYQ